MPNYLHNVYDIVENHVMQTSLQIICCLPSFGKQTHRQSTNSAILNPTLSRLVSFVGESLATRQLNNWILRRPYSYKLGLGSQFCYQNVCR